MSEAPHSSTATWAWRDAADKARDWLGLRGRLVPDEGMLMLLSVLGPVLLGVATHHPISEVRMLIFGAFQTSLVSVVGLYRNQSQAKLLLVGILIAELAWVNLIGGSAPLQAVSTFALMLVVGRSAALGPTSASIGLASAVAYIVLQAMFNTLGWGPNLVRACLLVGCGGLWAVLLNFTWGLVKPHTPLAQSVSEVFAALAQTVRSGSARMEKDLKDASWSVEIFASFEAVGQALTAARTLWADAGSHSRTSTPRDLQLLALIEAADRIANDLVLIAEQISSAWSHPSLHGMHEPIRRLWEQLALTLASMKGAIEPRHRRLDLSPLQVAIAELDERRETLRLSSLAQPSAQDHDSNIAVLVSFRGVVEGLERVLGYLQNAGEVAVNLTPRPWSERFRRFSPLSGPRWNRRRTLALWLRSVRSLRSLSTLDRHAVRYATIVTIGAMIGALPAFHHGYWVALHIVVVLKPDFGGTAKRSLERTSGTLWGSVLGMSLVALCPVPAILSPILLLLLFAAITVRPARYSLFVALITPAIILLIQLTTHEGWQVGLTRIVSSLVGVGLALLGIAFLFPKWERTGLISQLEKALASHLSLFKRVVKDYAKAEGATGSVVDLPTLRYQAAADSANLAAAVSRMRAEPSHKQLAEHELISLMSQLRRFAASVNALSFYETQFAERYDNEHFEDFCAQVSAILEDLVEALATRRSPNQRTCLEEPLAGMREAVRTLQAERRAEYAHSPGRDTALAQAVREQTPVLTQLERIAGEVKEMQDSIRLLQELVGPLA